MAIDKNDPWYRDDDESILEIYDVETDTHGVIKEFPYLIEAPNWSKDGRYLTYNSDGRIFKFDLETKESTEVPMDFVTNCNNDHVLSPDGESIAVSHGVKEDGKSRVYTVSLSGGVPRLITPLAPSYLHGWSPDGKTLAYCAERNGEFDVYTISAEGGVETRLTDAPGLNDGPEYARVGAVVNELHGEKIDIINWDENPAILIENALSPAKVIAVMADPDEKTALVVVPDYQLSLAIGKEGQNARLAARLTGFKIDIKSETQARESGDFYDDYDEEHEEAEEEMTEEAVSEEIEEAEEDTEETETEAEETADGDAEE